MPNRLVNKARSVAKVLLPAAAIAGLLALSGCYYGPYPYYGYGYPGYYGPVGVGGVYVGGGWGYHHWR